MTRCFVNKNWQWNQNISSECCLLAHVHVFLWKELLSEYINGVVMCSNYCIKCNTFLNRKNRLFLTLKYLDKSYKYLIVTMPLTETWQLMMIDLCQSSSLIYWKDKQNTMIYHTWWTKWQYIFLIVYLKEDRFLTNKV